MSEKVKTAFGMVTPAPDPIIPGQWMQDIAARMLRNTEESIRRSYMLQGVDPDNRPTVGVRVPRPAEFLARREDFATRWEAFVAEGLEEGYLEHDHCYECGGELRLTTDTDTVESHPNPDFDPDKPNPYAGGVTIVPVTEHGVINIPKTGDPR
jgi:hypothetical protein